YFRKLTHSNHGDQLACAKTLDQSQSGNLDPLDDKEHLAKKQIFGQSMENSFTVRLCHIKNKDHDYGFNLASKKFDLCKYVGRVEFNSPAYAAGLRPGDRIIEINNKNVSEMRYEEVVKLLKEGSRKENRLLVNEILLLVVDKFTDEHLKKLNLNLRFDEHKLPVYFKSNQMGNFKKGDEEEEEEIAISISLNKRYSTQSSKMANSLDQSYYTLI
ncbi:Na(+) H(+) exchange regulatory cofactor NHE-RF2, partial [Brachionus plicatilis]